MAQQPRMNQSYVYGNTVPAYNPENPEIEESNAYQRAVREREEIARQQAEERARLHARRMLARQKKASRMSVLAMSFATVLIFASCALYIHLNSQLKTTMQRVSALEGELINLTAENDSIEKKIETSVSLEDIRKKAMDELGMVYPSEDQIMYYHIENTDYMEQYKDIPTGSRESILKKLFGK